MLEELYDIIGDLGKEPDEWGKPYFSQDRYYRPFPLKRENVQGYEVKEPERVICSVDGGNNKIYESPKDSVHLLKIYFNLFKEGERIKNIDPFTAYLVAELDGDKINVRLKPLNNTIPIEKTEYTLRREEVDEGKPTSAGHTIRKYLEWKTLGHVAEEYLSEGDLIVRDGVLQTAVEQERKYAEQAYETIEDQDVYLTGIAKTSSLLTTEGYPLIASIQSLARTTEKGLWYYHPIAENEHPDHKGEMYVVKYHPSSNYAFRTEFYRDMDVPVEDLLGHLAFQAKDPIFLGYPYGLVDADKKARVTDEEVEYLKNMGSNKMDDSFRDKINSTNAHDRLSNI